MKGDCDVCKEFGVVYRIIHTESGKVDVRCSEHINTVKP